MGRLLSVQEGSENGDEGRAKLKGATLALELLSLFPPTHIPPYIICPCLYNPFLTAGLFYRSMVTEIILLQKATVVRARTEVTRQLAV